MALNINLIFCLIKYITIFGLRRKKERKLKILGSFSLGGCNWCMHALEGALQRTDRVDTNHTPTPEHGHERTEGAPPPTLHRAPSQLRKALLQTPSRIYISPPFIYNYHQSKCEKILLYKDFSTYFDDIYTVHIYIYIYTLLQQA